MSDENKAYQAIPSAALLAEITNVNVPKNEREWAAQTRIAELEQQLSEAAKEVERLRAQIVSGTTISIPTRAMAQEFQAHYRRGYDDALSKTGASKIDSTRLTA